MFSFIKRLLLIAALCVPWVTQAQGTAITSFPFTCNFEDASDNAYWSFQNASNGWYIGTAVNHGGTHALYVGEGSASSNSYNASASGVSYAYLTFDIANAGQYAIQFDWKCNGESTYDFLRVAVAPSTQSLTTTYGDWTATSVPSGFMAIDGGNKLNLQTSWQTHTAVATVPAAGTYRLLFVWRNDGSVANQPPAAIDNIVVTEISCPQPTALAAIPTTNQLDITWTAGGNETEWMVSINDGDEDFVSTTSYTFSNLTANTAYQVKVYAICGAGDTSLATVGNFRTSCPLIEESMLPFTENFETYGSGTTAFPTCWYKMGSTADRPYIHATTSYGHNNTHGLYFFAAASGYCYGVMPPVDPTVSLTTLQVSFWARQYSTSYNCDFVVGVMTNPTDATTFTPVGQVHPNGTTYEFFEVPLTTYTGTGNYIAFRSVQHPGSSTDIYMMLDDVTLETQPSCPGVANIETNVTTGSAMLTWQIRASGNGEVQNYTVNVTDSAGTTTNYTTSDMYYLLTGLTAGSEYKVVVTPDCGSDGYGHSDSVFFHTDALVCLELDETTLDTIAFSNSTSGQSGCLAYSSYGNTVYQTIYTAAELTAAGMTAGPVTGIDLGFTACSSYNKEFTIFIGNSNTTSISNATIEDPNNQLQVYGPAPHPTNTTGWQHYNFTTPFMWDGVSSIIVTTFMNQSGGSQTASTGLTGYYVSATNKARYRYKDSSPFTLTDFNSGNAGSNYTYRAAIHFYQGECLTLASCSAPYVEVTDVQSDEVTIAWIPGYDETAWNIDYRVAGATSWTNEATGVSINSYTFNNLNQATDYEFRVSFDCSGDNETYSTVVAASTLCNDVLLPYIEGFETVSTNTSTSGNYGVMPNCWDYELTGSSTYTSGSYLPGVYYSSTNANTGSYCLRLAGKGYFTLPPVATSLDSVMLSMSCYITSSGYNIEVGVMEANGTFVPISQHVLTTSQHTPIEVSFASYTGNSRVIALHNYYSTYDYSYVYIDDIVVDYLPDCPRIEGVTVNNIDQNNATVHWTATTVGDYEVLVGLNGFNPADSIPVVVNGADSIDLTGLSANTTYDVYVREICTGGGFGAWSYVHTFRTDCGAITVLPYFESFETYPVGSSTAPMYEIPCWARLDNAGQNHFGYVSSASSWAAGPHTGDKFIYYYLPSTTGTHCDWNITILPPIDTNIYPMNTLQLSFWVRMNSASTTSFIEVGVISDATDHTTFTPVDTVPVSGDVHTLKTAYLSTFTGSGDRIAMRFHRTPESTAHYFFIDDITIEPIPDCPSVSNISLVSADSASLTLTWTENGNATSWNIEYGPQGFTLGTGTTDIATSLPYTISNLSSNTAYDVYITPECNSGVAATSLGTFRTACGPITVLPYIENFDSYPASTATSPVPAGFQPPCWDFYNDGTRTNYQYSPYVYNSSTYAHSGSNSIRFYSYNSSGDSNQYLILPIIDSTVYEVSDLQVSFWVRGYSTSSNYRADVVVGVMTDILDESSFIPYDTVLCASTTYSYNEVIFSQYTGYNGRIAFLFPKPLTSSSYEYGYIDDVTIEPIPACPPVSNISLAGLDSNYLSVTWTENGDATSWSVEYGLHGFTLGTGTTDAVTTLPYTITGLTPNTEYDIYITPDCPSGTAASRMGTFRTANTYVGLPFSCNFENTTQNTLWTLENGTNTNKWYIGTATNNGGTHALYISDNNGTSNNYTISSSTMVYAYTDVMISTPGDYGYSFDWKCYGESTLDYIRAALVPVSETLTAATAVPSGFNSSSLPANWIALDGGSKLNLQSNWQTHSDVITIASAGVYHLVFAFRCDGSVGTMPPGAIDNVELAQMTCPRPANITLSNLTQTSVDVAWTEPGSATIWEYQLDNSAAVTTNTASCSLNGLTANTPYTFRVRSICGQGDTSMWLSYNFRTPCGYISLPYIQDFESESTSSSSTGSAFANCMTRLNNGTSYGGYPYVSSSSSYNHTNGGTKGLYWYNTTTAGTYGDYQYVVLPPVDPQTSVNTLQFSFWAKASSSSYNPVFKVGVMTDPNNPATFVGIDTIYINGNTSFEQYEVLLSTYTGTGQYVALKADRPTSSWYAYVDDIELDIIPTCPKVMNIHSEAATTTSITFDWVETGTAQMWEVIYGPLGFNQSTGNSMFVTSRPVTITGLDSATNYDVYVRPICGVGDTGRWTKETLTSGICDGMIEFNTGSVTGTNYYTPVNNYYNYTLSETIIDSTELSNAGFNAGSTFSTLAYSYAYSSPSTVKTDVDIWIQPTNKTTFSSTSDIEALSSNAVLVYSGALNCTQGWNYFQLQDTLPFVWDGHSNLMIIVDDNSYDYDGSSYIFNSSSCSGYKTIVYYSDDYNPDVTSASDLNSYSGSKTYYNYRSTMRLISCGNSVCIKPSNPYATDINYNSATLNWAGNADTYEVTYKAVTDGVWPDAVAVNNATSYVINNLTPATEYQFRVRAICDATENLISDWVSGTFVTDSLPCFTPTDLHTTNEGYTSVNLAWNASSEQSHWTLTVWNTAGSTDYDVTGNAAFTVTGLTQNTAYNAAVKAVCGNGDAESEYSDTIQFTTDNCEQVTGVTVNNITENSAVVSWQAATATSYEVDYGPVGHGQGQGTTVTVNNATTYTITGLESETGYSVYVRALCEADAPGPWSQVQEFTTLEEHIGIDVADGMNVSIYPNPTSSSTTIALSGVNGDVAITVVDMNGRVVMSDSMSCEGDCVKTMEVSGLAQGAYFVRINGENVNMVKKLVVK